MRKSLISLVLLLMVGPVGAATTYKCVDEHGKVTYSDKECEGGKEVRLPKLSTFSAPEVEPFKASGRDDEEDEKGGGGEVDYKAIAIVNPVPDQTLFANDGKISVAMSVSPRLGKGHSVVLYLDGAPTPDSPMRGLAAELENVARGSHGLKAAVLDEDGQTVIESPVTTFHVLQRTLNNPNNPNNPNRPNKPSPPKTRGNTPTN